MRITRERPCQRRHHRITAPLTIIIDGHSYGAVDWSLGGFKISGSDITGYQVRDRINCYFKLPFQGFDIAFETTAVVVRRPANTHDICAQFDALTERQIELMSHFIEELVRGSMTPVAETILRIDSPVTPVSIEPDPSPEDELPVTRRSTRMLLMSALYFSFGLSLVLYIVFTLYANFLSLEVDSGVVSAPVERIISTTDGRIMKVSAVKQKNLSTGDLLVVIEDADIEQVIEVAEISIERNRSLLSARQQELSLEQEKIYDYERFARNDLQQLEIQVEALRREESTARIQKQRMEKLLSRGFSSQVQIDVATQKQFDAQQRLLVAEIGLRKQKDTISSLQQGRYFTGDRFEGNVKELAVEVGRLKHEVTLATQELVALYKHRQRLSLNAPGPGRVVEYIKSKGSSTRRGEAVALFERDEERVVDVYLTQKEVLNITMHNQARIYFPSLDIAVSGIVVSIDRTDGFLDEKQVRYQWRQSGERTAKVTLAFVGLSQEQIRDRFAPGLPAVVIFPNQLSGTLGNFIRSIRGQLRPQQGQPITTTGRSGKTGGHYGQAI